MVDDGIRFKPLFDAPEMQKNSLVFARTKDGGDEITIRIIFSVNVKVKNNVLDYGCDFDKYSFYF